MNHTYTTENIHHALDAFDAMIAERAPALCGEQWFVCPVATGGYRIMRKGGTDEHIASVFSAHRAAAVAVTPELLTLARRLAARGDADAVRVLLKLGVGLAAFGRTEGAARSDEDDAGDRLAVADTHTVRPPCDAPGHLKHEPRQRPETRKSCWF